MSAASQVTGVLLAGGQSRRMGGGDKGLRKLAGKPMLQHVIDRIGPQTGQLVLNANGDPSRFSAFGLPVCADPFGDYAGPLAGVLAGLRWSLAHMPEARHIATVSTDAPFLPLDLVARLTAAVEGRRNAIALAASGGELHPVIGLWPVSLAGDLEAQLRAGVRKVLAWTDRHDTATVAFPFSMIGRQRVDPFFNANTLEELAEAEALIADAKL